MFTYENLAITNDITSIIDPLHHKLFPTYLTLLTLVISLFAIAYMIQGAAGKKEDLSSKYIHLIIVWIKLFSLGVLFTQIVSFGNLLADLIYTPDEMITFIKKVWVFEDLQEEMDVGLFRFHLNAVVAATFSYLALLAVIVVNKLRLVLLCIYYAFLPIVSILSMTPTYSPKMLIDWLHSVVQISLWPVIVSFLFWFMENYLKVSEQMDGNLLLDQIPTYAVIFVTIGFVPMLASVLFGGSNFVFMSVASIALAKQGGDSAKKWSGANKAGGMGKEYAKNKGKEWGGKAASTLKDAVTKKSPFNKGQGY